MEEDLPDVPELLAFTRTVEDASLSAAARSLGAPRATVGRRLARLEERLGVRLLRRTTRAIALTDAGEAFYRHARIVLEALQQAEASVRRGDGATGGSLRVSIPPVPDSTFRTMLCEFARSHPDVKLQINTSSRHVDLLREGYDVALRAGTIAEPGLVVRILSRDELIAVASPAYLQARGTPRSIRDLRDHSCLTGFDRGELPRTTWPRRGGGTVPVTSRFVSNDLALLVEAALRGLGIALLPAVMIARELERGELVRVLPEKVGADGRIGLVYTEREFLPSQVRAFIEAVVAWSRGRFQLAAPSSGREGPSPLPGPGRRERRSGEQHAGRRR